ncbi:hypothetical protein M3Y99_00280800 [Aphelenchoides fujianensis]|nr:hypothetical protein M3Y99_00280800 [Aphelenchoides fujianensis]
MSRGKSAFRRGNRPLAWFMDSQLLEKCDQERDDTPSPALNDRKNSVDSQSSANSASKQPGRDAAGEAPQKRKNRSRQRRPSGQPPPKGAASPVGSPPDAPLHADAAAAIPQQFGQPPAVASGPKDRENYFYYDVKSDGFYYEQNGSRGWRKRNPKLHGNAPLSVGQLASEVPVHVPQPQIIEKKVYVPVPIFTSGHAANKFFAPGGPNMPNIKYYDPSSDGFVFELPSVDGWRRRQPAAAVSQPAETRPKPEACDFDSMAAFPPLGRDLSVGELEDLVLSNVKTAPVVGVPFASAVARGLSARGGGGNTQLESSEYYPSSASTVSSSVSDDMTPPPPARDPHSTQLVPQHGREALVGSLEEPYEFFWSENEEQQRTVEPASSVSSADDAGLSAYFNQMRMLPEVTALKNMANRVKRPSSLKIDDPPHALEEPQKQLASSRFNVDRFIADLPGVDNERLINTLTAACTPFPADAQRSSFNYLPTKDSPLFTPILPQANPWTRAGGWERAAHELQRPCAPKAAVDTPNGGAEMERKMRELIDASIWATGF